ncbi:hypothetical protein CCP3SC5AM1_20004 [Gammaproteobacteria bacterium]
MPSCGATTANKVAVIGTLAAGAVRTVTFTGLAAGGAGKKTLRAFVDSACATNESSETNNQLTQSYTIPGQADFVVTGVVITPATPVANGVFSAAITVKNQGAVTGNAGFLDIWTNQPIIQTCGDTGDGWAAVGELNAGQSKTVTVVGLPAGISGVKTLRTLIDSWCEISESNETNNQFTKTITVR